MEVSGRFEGDLPGYLTSVVETRLLPVVFQTQKADPKRWFHLTCTKELRDTVASESAFKFCNIREEGGKLNPGDKRIY